jgi:hypothetical protein
MQHGRKSRQYRAVHPKEELLISVGRVVESCNGRSLPHVVALGDLIASSEGAYPDSAMLHRTAMSLNTNAFSPLHKL